MLNPTFHTFSLFFTIFAQFAKHNWAHRYPKDPRLVPERGEFLLSLSVADNRELP